MYSTIRVDTRWHEERPFYAQKAAGANTPAYIEQGLLLFG